MAMRGGGQFYPGLEAARGIAALMVALLHVGQSSFFDASGQKTPLVSLASQSRDMPWGDLALRILGNGSGAVIFFFVLSGFVLTLSLRGGVRQLPDSARRFFIARLFRIYPAVIVTVLVFVLTWWMTGVSISADESYAPLNILLNALLVKTDINGVMWSLKLEVIAAPVIFAAVWLATRFGPRALALASAVFLALSFVPEWSQSLIGAPASNGALYAFLIGIAACLYAAPMVRRIKSPAIWMGAALTGFLLSRALLGWWSNWSSIAESLFSAGIIALLAYAPLRWRGGEILGRIVRYYGRISYSFYLLHPLSLCLVWNIPGLLTRVVDAGVPRLGVALMLFVLTALAITPLAHLQWSYVERVGAMLPGLMRARRAARA